MEYLSNLGELYLSGAGQVFTPSQSGCGRHPD